MLKTRKPTGQPAWPLLLLAGQEKAGKSYSAAEASTSHLIGATYWIAIGEDEPDELGRVGDFEIVEHDGTYQAILAAVKDVAALPPVDGKPVLLVLDSMSMIWSMLTDEAQMAANRRARQKAEKYSKPMPTEDVTISMDLWNTAAKKWRRLMDAIRAHRGPVILTARLNQVSILNAKGDPTGEKDWKIEGHKTLPFDASAIVQLRSRAERFISGVKSTIWQTEPEALIDFPTGRTIADLWQLLGLEESADRIHHAPDGGASLAAEEALRNQLLARLAKVGSPEKTDAFWQATHGEPITEASDLDALREFVEQGEQIARDRGQQKQARPEPTSQVEQLPEAPESVPEPEQAIVTGNGSHVPNNPPLEEQQEPAAARKPDMLAAIAMHLDRLGVAGREDKLAYLSSIVGRQLTSSKDLEPMEQRSLVTRLSALRDPDALDALVAQAMKGRESNG